MPLPYVMKHQDTDLPPLGLDETRIVVGANGVFRERHNHMFSSSTKVDPSELGLADHYQYCQLRCGKLNRVMHRVMLSFFCEAHQLHGGEAALVLLYHPERRRFRWHCPVQTIEMHSSGGRWYTSDFISWDNPTQLSEGYVHFGDCHLHTGNNTTPSWVDTRDDQDGLHVIVAGITGKPRYNIDFVVDGKRFGVAPALIFEDPDCLSGGRTPARWMKRVRIERYVPYQWQDTRNTDHNANRFDDPSSAQQYPDRGPRNKDNHPNSGNGELRA